MHRALSIPEVLRLVLSSDVGRATMRNAALTCTLWMDPALDELWKDLDSVFPLLWVFVPLRVERKVPRDKLTIWTTDAPLPRPGAWNRLETYARRVRTLVFDVDPTIGDTVPLKTLQTIVQFRPPRKDVLPNLRKLTYIACGSPLTVEALSPLLAFLGASIVELNLLRITAGAAPELLEYLSQRAPQVQNFRIEGSSSTVSLYTASSSALASSLVQLEGLTSLEAAAIPLTPAIWDAMAQHPSLVSAEFFLLPLAPDAIGFQPRVFAKLASLSIRAKFDHLCGLFESQNDLPTITRISICGRRVEQGSNDFRRLCDLFVQKLPNLACLKLGFHSAAQREAASLKLEDFRPLLQCKKLHYFRLEHPCGVSVTTSEVSELLKAWPGIDTLVLQYNTYDNGGIRAIPRLKWTPSTLPLSVLDTIVAKAPKIKELGLVLDATTMIDRTPGTCQQQFECLQVLDVTLSTISRPGNVASYLAQRCKKSFSLKFVQLQWVQEGMEDTIDGEKKKWDQVEEHLRLLYDQKERLEKEFKRRLDEERARYIRE